MRYALLIGVLTLGLFPSLANAEDVHVDGYYRKDGTYVAPHVRSSPDSDRSNNYGPSGGSYSSPRQRDHERDGTSNYLDRDDDNDGRYDNQDSSQYGRYR